MPTKWEEKPPWVEEARDIYESNDDMSWQDVTDVIKEKYPENPPGNKSTLYKNVKKYEENLNEINSEEKEDKKEKNKNNTDKETNNRNETNPKFINTSLDIGKEPSKLLVIAMVLFGIFFIILSVT